MSAPKPHDPGRGVLRAARYAPRRVEEAITEYKRLNTRGARIAFADHWIGLWARDFDEAWPLLYELLHLVEEEGLYKDPRRVGPTAAGSEHGNVRGYDSFAEYFEDRVSRPFGTWAELESTYRYVEIHKPELFGNAYGDVVKRLDALERELAAGKTINAAGNHHPEPGVDIIHTRTKHGGGTSAEYNLRRLVRDHPDVAARLKTGEFRSVHAAARAAGIAHRVLSIRLDDPASAARSLIRNAEVEFLQALVSELQEFLGANHE